MKKNIFIGMLLLTMIFSFAACSKNNSSNNETSEHIHSFGEWVIIKDATCSEKGMKMRSCSCHESETDYILFADHSFGDWIIVKEATCNDVGLETAVCKTCNAEKNKEIDATGAHETTEILQGDVQYTKCTLCGIIISSEKVELIDSVGLDYEVNDDGVSCTIIGIGSCTDTHLVIPEKIDGLTVTGIGEEAFMEGAEFVEKITLPNTVTYIGGYALAGTLIKEIRLPKSFQLFDLGESDEPSASALLAPFLENIYIDPQHEDYKSEGGILWNKEMTEILAYPIGRVDSEYIIPDGITAIGDGAFAYCTNLTKVVLPDGLKKIDSYAFYYCDNLREINLPESINEIGSYAFEYCDVKTITIPEGVTRIEEHTFMYSLENVTLPSTLVYIGEHAFHHTKIKEIVLPEGLITIEGWAFCLPNNLEKVTIPSTVEYIGKMSFASTGVLTTIIYNGSIADWNSITKDPQWDDSYSSAVYIIYCIDGEIAADGNVTYY